MAVSKIITHYDNLGVTVRERSGVIEIRQIMTDGDIRVIAVTRGVWNAIVEATKEKKDG